VIALPYTYVTVLCSWPLLFQDLLGRLPEVGLALEVLAGGYLVPAALALMTLVRWFEGTMAVDRAANQRAVLRGLLAALLAWAFAALVGLVWKEGLSDPGWERVLSAWVCWQGPPFPSIAAATGTALGTAWWRRNWHWGLISFLVTGFWAGAQVCLRLYYPMDIVVGTLIGAGLGWLLGAGTWLDRPLGVFIRVARRWMLA
jgi:hypothetical protein